MNIQDVQFLTQFLSDSSKAKGVTQEKADEISELINQYKKNRVEEGDVVLSVEFGKYGNVQLREALTVRDEADLTYTEGDYEYINLVAKEKVFLFTDHLGTEPFDRQGAFYIGYSFESLNLIDDNGSMRVFSTQERQINISFAVWGFTYNSYWNSVRFGICVSPSDKDEFLNKFYKIVL